MSRIPLEEILRLLRETDLEVKDIAKKLGCCGSNITVRLKNNLNMLPTEYRLQHGWIPPEGTKGQRAIAPWIADQIVEIYAEGVPLYEVRDRTGVGTDRIESVLRARGVEIRPGGSYGKVDYPEEQIVREYQEGDGTPTLGRRYSCDEITIRRILKKHGIKQRPRGMVYKNTVKPNLRGAEAQAVVDRYAAGESSTSIGRDLGIHYQLVLDACRRLGVEVRPRRNQGGDNQPNLVPSEEVELMVKRYVAGESSRKIADDLGRSSQTVLKHVRRRGVEVRPRGSQRNQTAV